MIFHRHFADSNAYKVFVGNLYKNLQNCFKYLHFLKDILQVILAGLSHFPVCIHATISKFFLQVLSKKKLLVNVKHKIFKNVYISLENVVAKPLFIFIFL